jgi:hypothetical protein
MEVKMSETLREVLVGHAENLNAVHPESVNIDSEADDAGFQEEILTAFDALEDWAGIDEATTEWVAGIFNAEREAAEGGDDKGEAKADEAKDKAAEKKAAEEAKKVAAAKAAAKKKAASTAKGKPILHYKLYQAGSGSDQIYQIVKAAGEDGIKVEDVIKEAINQNIKSTNIASRVKDVLKMATVVPVCKPMGILTVDKDGIYRARSDEELERLRAEERKELGIPDEKPAEKPAEKSEKDAEKTAEKAEAPAEKEQEPPEKPVEKEPAEKAKTGKPAPKAKGTGKKAPAKGKGAKKSTAKK